MAKLVDALDLGSSGLCRVGSSPIRRTNGNRKQPRRLCLRFLLLSNNSARRLWLPLGRCLLCLENLPNILHSFSHPQLLYSPIVDLPTSFWPFLFPTNHSFSYFLCHTTRHKGTRKHREEDGKCLINPHQYPPTLFQQTDIVYTFILFLMLGMNTSIKFYFKEKEDRERIDARRRKLPYSTPLVLHLCRQRFQAWHHLPKALLHQRKDRDRKHNTPALQQ